MTGDDLARRLVCIGKVVGVRGLDGWLKVYSYTRNRADLFQYRRWFLKTQGCAGPYELESGRELGRGLVAKLRGVDERDAAAALVAARICVAADELPAQQAGQYFWHQLEGLKVEALDGCELGTVDHLFETGANDVMVVLGDRERLIPWGEAVVREVDLNEGIIRVDWDPEF